jgi:hypothetical protein
MGRGGLSIDELDRLASKVVEHLRRQVRPQCFVMMPFRSEYDALYTEVLEPAIKSVHLDPLRVDIEHLVGNVVNAIRSAATTCVCGVAVLTEVRPNVTYEIGLMHGQNKPVVIVCEFLPHSEVLPELPYDLRVDRVIGYSETKLNQLREHVEAALNKLLELSLIDLNPDLSVAITAP